MSAARIGTTKIGRPKGTISSRVHQILDRWDSLRKDNPKANKAAILDLVAEAIHGKRLNPLVRKKERVQLRRTLKRHGRR